MTERTLLFNDTVPQQLTENRQLSQDITALLQVTHKIFPEILTLNLNLDFPQAVQTLNSKPSLAFPRAVPSGVTCHSP